MHLWDKGQIQAYDDLVMLPNARDHERRVTAPGPGVRVLAEPAGQQLHYLGPAPSVKVNKTSHTPSKLCSTLRPKFFNAKTAKAFQTVSANLQISVSGERKTVSWIFANKFKRMKKKTLKRSGRAEPITTMLQFFKTDAVREVVTLFAWDNKQRWWWYYFSVSFFSLLPSGERCNR